MLRQARESSCTLGTATVSRRKSWITGVKAVGKGGARG